MAGAEVIACPTIIAEAQACPIALEGYHPVGSHAAGLQRPADLRVIYADEKLRAVAGTDVITMYALEELIQPHLEPIV